MQNVGERNYLSSHNSEINVTQAYFLQKYNAYIFLVFESSWKNKKKHSDFLIARINCYDSLIGGNHPG